MGIFHSRNLCYKKDQLIAREENMGGDDNKSLVAHVKKGKTNKEEQSCKKPRRYQKDYS